MTRIALEPAWLLSVRPYRDTSALVEAFTPHYGRVGLVARGARGPRSRLRGLLQPLQPLLIGWRQAGELGTLASVEAAGPPVALAGDRVFYAWYLHELLLKLLQRQDAHPGLFDAYVEALPRLAGAGAEAALRLFELRLLAEIGYGLPLPAAIEPGLRYGWSADAGFAAASAADAYAGTSLLALREERLDDPQVLADARRLLRAALAGPLGDRRLETPRLLRELRAGVEAPDPGPEGER